MKESDASCIKSGSEASLMCTCIYCGTPGWLESPVCVEVRYYRPIQTLMQLYGKDMLLNESAKMAYRNEKEVLYGVKITSGWRPVRGGHAAREILRHAKRGRLHSWRREIGKHPGRREEAMVNTLLKTYEVKKGITVHV